MSSGKHLLGGAPGKKPGPTLSQEHGLPAALPSRPNVQAQPSAQSSNQQALETQDWVRGEPAPGLPAGRGLWAAGEGAWVDGAGAQGTGSLPTALAGHQGGLAALLPP